MPPDDDKGWRRTMSEAPIIAVGCCAPPQQYDTAQKLAWLHKTLSDGDFDAFFLPQEWLGGHYAQQLAAKHGKQIDLHFEPDYLDETFGGIAKKYNVALGIGACVIRKDEAHGGATEDYLYFDKNGAQAGWHRKFALPAYDDVRANGAGRLWPETDFRRRITPIDLPLTGLRVGTVFCWEIYSRALVPAYSFNDVNLIVHPIKFAPRGWPKKTEGTEHVGIASFGQAPKSEDWINRLLTVAHYEAMCPVAISCNTWELGSKFMAITGHVDPFEFEHRYVQPDDPSDAVDRRWLTYAISAKHIVNVSSEEGSPGRVHAFSMNPRIYSEGINNAHSAGAYKAVVGSFDGLKHMQEATMSRKLRRIEAQLIGGTTKQEVALLAARHGGDH
jgi:hypothetical protein